MNTEWFAVFTRIAAMALVMFVGWLARRLRLLGGDTTASLGRFTVDVTFPALTLTQMLQLVKAEDVQQSGAVLVLGVFILLVSCALGWVTAPWVSAPEHRHTVAFAVAIPNWIFLPLPIAAALCGAVGIRTVLLINIPSQLILWTLGVIILRGGLRGVHSMRALLLNPGLVATAAGIVVALLVPSSRDWHAQSSAIGAVIQGLAMLGDLTVPLSLVVIGAQLAELDTARPIPWRELGGILALRLLLVPMVTVALVELLLARVLALDPEVRLVGHVIAAMPVAVSVGMFVERFGGDRDLAARSILFSTLASLATVPAVIYVAGLLR